MVQRPTGSKQCKYTGCTKTIYELNAVAVLGFISLVGQSTLKSQNVLLCYAKGLLKKMTSLALNISKPNVFVT
jgi:hypothetical protein